MTDRIFFLIGATIIMALLVWFGCAVSAMHTKGKEHCDELHGVWLDRELKCIEGKELK